MIISIVITFKRFLDSLLDFVYPPLCISCNRLLKSSRDHVCGECWSAIAPAARDLPLFIETRDKLVLSGAVDDLVSLFVFEKEGPFQNIAHALKYAGVQQIGFELGRRLGYRIREEGVQADMIVPVPLHRRKLRERGYNQAALIARGISEICHIPLCEDAVVRMRWTETQTTLSKQERRRNVQDAFTCKSLCVKRKRVIVIDDVITTGATIEAVAVALKEIGAVEIVAASAAIAR